MDFVNFLSATLPAGVTDSFPIIRTVIIIVMVVLSLALIFLVLAQPSNEQGMNAITGQTADTFYAKNKSKTLQGAFKRLTVIVSIVLAVLSLVFFITLAIYSGGVA